MADFELAPDFGMETTPEFKTLISEFENGVEQRRPAWSSKRRSWRLFFKNRSSDDLDIILDLFNSNKGAFGSFSWLNALDNEIYNVRFAEDSITYANNSFGLFDFEFSLIEVK